MFTEFDEFDRSPKGQTFDQLWSNQSDSTVVDTAIVKQADFAGNSVERAIQDRSFAGSHLVPETIELRRQIEYLMDEKYEYPVIESILKKKSYSVMHIRQQFQEITGIDPVVAYMDVELYSKPPAEVPRYNYGWGESKKTAGAFCFVLPYVQHYAVWEQNGFDRKVVSEHVTLTEARKALDEAVKDTKDISPEFAVGQLDPIVRIASLSLEAKEVLASLKQLPVGTPLVAKRALLEDYIVAGTLTEEDAKVIAEAITPPDAAESYANKKAAPQDDFDRYRDTMDTLTLDEAVETLKVPQRAFDSKLETSHQVSTLDVAQKAFKRLEEMSQQIQGYVVKPIGHSVDLKDVEFFVEEGRERVDTGSVSLIVEIVDRRSNKKAEALLIMFVVNGDLMWAGTLKGSNNKEYALSQAGIDAYFQDLSGSSLSGPMEVLPSGENGSEDSSKPSMDSSPLRY